METSPTQKEDALRAAIKQGLSETIGIVDQMGEGLVTCAHLLRTEQSEKSFSVLSKEMENLNQLVEFIKELKTGIRQLKGFNVPGDIFSCWDKSVGLFNEMLSACEGQDWITLADLIEYEINPLLVEGKKGLSQLNETIMR